MTPAEKVEVLRACCCVAGADQNTGLGEKDLLDRLAREIGVGRASLNAMIARSENDPDFHRQQFQILKANPEKSMSILIEVAAVDGVISDNERSILHTLGENLELTAQTVDSLIQSSL